MIRSALTVATLLLPLAAPAADPLELLVSASTLRCEFRAGTATRWRDGEPASGTDRFRDAVVVEDIDHEQGSARIRGSAGSAEVVIVASVLGVTFLEGTEAGNLNVITVYPWMPGEATAGEAAFAAVMSRHVMIGGQPAPSQHHGTCRPGQ